MAARESQGLQIFLMITVALCVMLAVFAYLFYTRYTEQLKITETEKNKAQEASQRARQSDEQNQELKKWMGFTIDTPIEQIKEQFAKDMKKYAENFPENVRFYAKLIEYQGNRLAEADARELDLTDKITDLQNQYEIHETANNEQLAKYKAKMDEFQADLVGVREDLNKQLLDKQKTADDLDMEKQKLQAKVTEVTVKSKEQMANDALDIRKLQGTVATLAQQKRERNDENFEIADGAVRWVNQATGLVWIDVGKADGLQPKTTFKVYGVDENDAHVAPSKGSIEVMRLLENGTMAEARVTSDTLTNPILPGDKIYTPLWHRGRHERFALVGLIDIDGDGRSDLKQVQDIIKNSGGVIDAVMLDDGKVTGSMSVHTRFLVQGEQPSVATTGNGASIDRAINSYSNMIDDARNLGITPISVAKFLDHIGWQPEDRSGHSGTGTTSSGFRERRPSRITF